METMKRLLLVFIVVMSLAITGIVCWKPAPQPVSAIKAPQVEELKNATPISPQNPVPAIINEINERNKGYHSFACEDIKIRAWQKGVRVKLDADLFYEKDKKFRFVAKSVLGKEFEMGSNESEFWFWSKRMQPYALYFAKHEDYHKTRLKTPFDPKLMQQAIAINTIDVSKSKLVELSDKYIIVDNMTNSVGQPICKFTYISKAHKRIDGFLVVNKDAKNIVSSEVMEWEGNMPKQILFVWFDEDVSMLLDLKNPKLNAGISSTNWTKPNISPMIDMGKDGTGCFFQENQE